jgi:hypothetical protein
MKKAEADKAFEELRGNITAVSLREAECPVCSVSGTYTGKYVEDIEKNGEIKTVTGDCPCVRAHGMMLYLQSQGLHGRYLRGMLKSLKPSDLCKLDHEKQAKVIAKVQAAPDEGWAFFGPPDTGKTTLTVAIYKSVIGREWFKYNFGSSYEISQHVWRVTARQLCDEAQDYATGKYEDGVTKFLSASGPPTTVYTPTVTRAKILRAKQKNLVPHLFLEEMDKVNLTEFRRAAIFDVYSAVHECEGQIVLNSNLSWDEFVQTFGETVWRIDEACNKVDFFRGTVHPPKVAL